MTHTVARGANFVFAKGCVVDTYGEDLRTCVPAMFLERIDPACLGCSTKAVTTAGGRDISGWERARSQQPTGDWEIVFDLQWKE
jgi:hypothetical protein